MHLAHPGGGDAGEDVAFSRSFNRGYSSCHRDLLGVAHKNGYTISRIVPVVCAAIRGTAAFLVRTV